MRLRLLPLFAAVLCAGCLFPGPRKTYLAEYTGAEPGDAAPAARPAAPAVSVRVGPILAAEPYASSRMLVWEEKTGRLHGTKEAQLATPPAAALQNSVRRALAESGAFASVADASLAARGGASLRGFVEKARLERRADGSNVYALDATFVFQNGDDQVSLSFRERVPAAGSKPADQARAAGEAASRIALAVRSSLTSPSSPSN